MHVAAVCAAHTFYSATTLMKVKAVDRFGAPTTRKIKTKMLCQTTDPEEKRTIIGDTFMNVHLIHWHLCIYYDNYHCQIIIVIYLRERRRYMFLPMFVCLSVSKTTQKCVHGFGRNVAYRQMSAYGRTY